VRGSGPGAAAALAAALARECGLGLEVLEQQVQKLGEGPQAATVVYLEARRTAAGGTTGGAVRWGVGRDADPDIAALRALISAANRQ
jgi:hypothetical protein